MPLNNTMQPTKPCANHMLHCKRLIKPHRIELSTVTTQGRYLRICCALIALRLQHRDWRNGSSKTN